jgi:hypothetical protein
MSSVSEIGQEEWAAMIDSAIAQPAFLEAWDEVGEAGIGSTPALSKIFELIRDNDWHRGNILKQCEEHFQLAGGWAEGEMTRENNDALGRALFSKIGTLAACYLIMGFMTGISFVTIQESQHADRQ